MHVAPQARLHLYNIHLGGRHQRGGIMQARQGGRQRSCRVRRSWHTLAEHQQQREDARLSLLACTVAN
jgi:hypothetical protein